MMVASKAAPLVAPRADTMVALLEVTKVESSVGSMAALRAARSELDWVERWVELLAVG